MEILGFVNIGVYGISSKLDAIRPNRFNWTYINWLFDGNVGVFIFINLCIKRALAKVYTETLRTNRLSPCKSAIKSKPKIFGCGRI